MAPIECMKEADTRTSKPPSSPRIPLNESSSPWAATMPAASKVVQVTAASNVSAAGLRMQRVRGHARQWFPL
jgi:hypothetical protein